MNLQKFNELFAESRGVLYQREEEWRQFLETVESYFENRGIAHPVVVEIGTAQGKQKRFYQELMGAEHIGIDNAWTADIMADSHDSQTTRELKRWLSHRPIDLLFIDGGHAYNSAECDYRFYAPLTKHLIALHDIFLTGSAGDALGEIGIGRLWAEIIEKEKGNTYLTFKHHTSMPDPWGGPWQMGIGLIIKQGT